MYVCGPTVYDNPHIGNARPLVIFDILFKVLKHKYGNDSVEYVRNITDIDDKIIKSANDNKISIQDLTNKVIKNFKDDCNFLNLESPSKEPKATDHIGEMIEMISDLIKKDFAYEKNNHVYHLWHYEHIFTRNYEIYIICVMVTIVLNLFIILGWIPFRPADIMIVDFLVSSIYLNIDCLSLLYILVDFW